MRIKTSLSAAAILIALIAASFLATGCRPNAPEKEPTPATENFPKIQPGEKAIVVYFSRTGEMPEVGTITEGNTAIVAKMIAEQTGAELFELKPLDDKYPGHYKALATQAKREQDADARPKYATPIPNLAEYDVVFFGAPVWWGDWPQIMKTLFDDAPLSGKKLVPFCTHAGSGESHFRVKLYNFYPTCNVLPALAILGADTQDKREEVAATVGVWLARLGYDATFATPTTPDELGEPTTSAAPVSDAQ